jgi:LacI family transcriptional regulator
VLLNQERDAPGFNSIGVDLAAGARIAVEHLIGHGHTNIGLAMGTNVSGSTDGREVGWREALQEAGLPEGPIVYSAFTRPGGHVAGQRLLASVNRPTAIFATSDMQGIGLLRAIHEAGLAVPGDIAVASFDGSAESEYSWPPLTTVEQPVAVMAEAAVAALVGASRGEKPRHRIFPTKLHVRQSCGCP